MSKKLTAQEYAEMRSEDPSQLVDNPGMDISPESPWKTPGKIDVGADAGKDDDTIVDGLQKVDLDDYKKLQAENKELKEKLAAPGSSGKYGNPERHDNVLINTKHIIDGVKALEGDKCALWWCNYHIEKLLQGDKPACYDSYKVHAKNTL